MSRSSRMILSAFVFLFVIPCAQAQDDKVFRTLTPEAAEKLLTELKIEFKKISSKKGDEHFYELPRGSFRVVLTQISPQEMLLDCVFRGIPIDKVNQWNSVTRVARANHQKDNSGEFTLLEYGLDLSGGVTAGTIKQYVTRFDEELKKYEKFVAANGGDDTILAEVTDDKIESVLKTQGIAYTKASNPSGAVLFDFELNGHKLRLYNFGGKDLMMDVRYRKVSLEDANRYNLNRKFVRVVNYRGKDTEYTSLEINLDCEAGVSEGMIRHWIVSFGEDARHFGDYAKKLQALEKK